MNGKKASAFSAALFAAALILISGGLFSCKMSEPEGAKAIPDSRDSEVVEIVSTEEFRSVIASTSGLILIDLYADWCDPCKLLEPIMEEIARGNVYGARIYRIDVEQNRSLARSLGMTGIPYVVYFKDHAVVHSRVGLFPKEIYMEDIRRFS
jgi:thioredoxin 1